MDLNKVSNFLQNGTQPVSLTKEDRQVLHGWKDSTLISYNTAVSKFNRFKSHQGISTYQLPITALDVYQFAAWAGRGSKDDGNEKITAKTLNRYLFAIKVWHTFHDVPYPYQLETRMKLMLKALGRFNAEGEITGTVRRSHSPSPKSLERDP
jgi:hypothetical protein